MSKEVTKKDESEQFTVQSAIMELVKRGDVDPARLEHFLDLQVKMEDRQAEQKLSEALTNFQTECPIIKKTKKAHNSSYAPLDEIVYEIRPFLKKYGLSYSFSIEPRDERENDITVTIRHTSGAKIESRYTFPRQDDGGKMNRSQATKSANSYAKRVALENALGIVTAGEDDDARRAVDSPANQEQIDQIETLVKNTETKREDLLKFLKVSELSELSEHEAKKAIHALKQKRSKVGGVK